MIIGINGKIGSGKDTIGSIIQCLINHPKVTNKDLLWMIENNVVAEEYSKCEIKKFAGKLKEIASLLTGIDIEDFEDQEFKKTNLEKNWDVKSKYRDRRPPTPMTVREFLQKLGTEAMREGLHTNVWVNALFADYKHSKTCNCKKGCRCAHDLPNWIITDMRFPNEMEAVVEKGGITIRVVRPGTVTGEHPSEIALDGHTMHYEIINDGTIEDLVEKVREILIERNII
jgi:hypothetical protein